MAWAEQFDMHPTVLVGIGPQDKILIRLGTEKTIDVPMPIASISKTIAGQCVMYMAKQNLLSLDSKIRHFLDWSDPQGEVTVIQLLTHTSGFSPDETQIDTIGNNLPKWHI